MGDRGFESSKMTLSQAGPGSSHGLKWAPKMRRLAKVEPCPLESAAAQEQEMKRTRKKHNGVIKAKGWWWRQSGGPDDRRVGE